MNFSPFKRPGARPRRPLRTITELADEFHESKAHLVHRMRRSPVPAPAPQLRTKGTAGHQTWYDPVAVRRWNRADQQARSQLPQGG